MENLGNLAFLILNQNICMNGAEWPSSNTNIFDRIIRDPSSRAENERRCSEMLCAVLMNTRELRNRLLLWLGKIAGKKVSGFEDLSWEFKTQLPAEGKLIDLSIEGKDAETGAPRVFWIVEIKVKSPFNKSRAISAKELDEEEEKFDKDDVDQLENYDKILGKNNEAVNKAGFVLTLRDAEEKLPEGLKNEWTCTTWTGLGLELEDILIKSDKLPDVEQFLGRHMLGFIRKNLWKEEEMPEEKLELTFEDVALIKATYEKAVDLEKKLTSMLSNLEDTYKKEGIGSGEFKYWANLFSASYQVGIKRKISPGVYFSAGFAEKEFFVWLDAEKEISDFVGTTVNSALKKLQAKDKNWKVENYESGRFADVTTRISLEEILGSRNQLATMGEFVKRAYGQLEEAKIICTIQNKVGKSKKRKK